MVAPSSDVRHTIDRIADAFEEAWLTGGKPRIESFLKEAGAARRDALVELAFTDLEYRLRAGETHVVEDLGKRFPEMKVDADLWRALIVEEHHQRQRLGQHPTKDEYQKRFPDQASNLETAFGVAPASNTVLPTRAYSCGGKLPTLGTRYRAQRIVAEGGMGYVARILDTEFDRPLAMKALADKLKGNAELEERFLREARLTGQLQHPGIPPVQEKGRLPDGTPYFIMKLIKGHSLQKLLRDRSSPNERLPHFVGMFGSLCQTMAYAHSRGIIHRDLKPANIMVGNFGEVQVMDWGLAKVLRSDSKSGPHAVESAAEYSSTVHIVQHQDAAQQHTVAGAIMGTPGYMAPEQARGEVDLLDQRCDVFGLGSILCDILTGAPPFAPSSGMSSQRLAMTGDLNPAFARLDQSGADAELIALAKQCLAPDLHDRPADAKAVADAIAAYQTQVQERLKQAELEQARLIAKAHEEKMRRRDRRILGGCIAVLLVCGVMVWQWYQRKFAEAAAERSQTVASQSVRQLDNAISLVKFGFESLKTGALEDSRKTLEQAKAVADDTRNNKEKTALAAADAQAVADKLTEYDAAYQSIDKHVRLAEQLDAAFEGRGQLKESDYDVRVKASVVFGKTGPKIYREAFASFGAPLPGNDAAASAEQLKAFPLQKTLGLGLIDWMLFERTNPKAKQLADVAEILDADPVDARLRRGILDRDAADLVALSKELDVTAHPPRLVILLADALNGLNRPDDVLALLTRAHDDIPGDFWINELLGVYIRVLAPERNPEAVARFESAYVLRPKAPFVTSNLARSFIVAKRYDLAQKVCESYLKQVNPDEPLVRLALVDALLFQDKTAEAEKMLLAALERDEQLARKAGRPVSGFLRASLANVYSNAGQHQQAGELAKGALDDFPGFMNAILPFGYAHLRRGDPKKALEVGEYLIDWNPKVSTGYDLAAQASVVLKDHKTAQKYARKGVEVEPKNWQTHNTLGYVLFEGGDYMGGFSSYQKAMELNPAPMPYMKDAGATLASMKRHPQAAWIYAEVYRRDPKDKAAWDGLVNSLRVTGDVADARTHLSSTKLSPEQTQTLDAIAPPDSRPVNSPAMLSRPINAQQNAMEQGSKKKNR